MSALDALLSPLQDAILRHDPACAVPLVRRNARIAPERQLAIYLEGYRTRLVLAVRSDYPELLALLGEAAFDALALAYVEQSPSSHFNLDRYPHGFAAFAQPRLDAFARNLARVEAAIAEVFMAQDSDALPPAALAGLAPEDFGAQILIPRRASRLLALAYPINDYLLARREGKAPELPLATPSFLFLVRHHNEVRRHALETPEHALLQAICTGLPVGAAIESVAAAQPDFVPAIAEHLQGWFARWLGEGFFQPQTE